MENEYKRIVLLKGLYPISDFHFRTVKSLIAKDLNLKGSKHEEYDKVKFVDLMAEKFKSDAGLGKLITIFKDIPDLQETAKSLRKEKEKVADKKKCKGKRKSTGKSAKEQKSSTVQHVLTTPQGLQSESETDLPSSKVTSEINTQESDCPTQPKKKKKKNPTKKTDDLKKSKQEVSSMPEKSATTTALQNPLKPALMKSSSTQKKKNTASKTDESITIDAELPTTSILPDGNCPQTLPKPSVSSLSSLNTPQKPRLKCVPSEPSEESGYQPNCKEVMVLKVTEPFVYNFDEPDHKMIHATVATENEFFQVKVFDMAVKDLFIPKNVLSISHYIGRDGFLEIYSYSAVSDVSANRSLNISSTLIQRAKASPKISQICSPCKRKYVNGTFTVCKKTERGEFIFYEIEDNTGRMEVIVRGWLRNFFCEEGDKLSLTCFEVASKGDSYQLRSVLHSYLKVNKTRKSKIYPGKLNSNTDVESIQKYCKPECH